ncbi:fructose-1,6-bisphosphatase [Candidatus Woesearchaeota archaeon]|nr:MAG: fructose-1,6-bisphosphatase [Candidatus Woesearchaeota archaeon]
MVVKNTESTTPSSSPSSDSLSLKEHLSRNVQNRALAELILLISDLAKPISDAFHGKQGFAGTKNIYGENQLEIDKWADRTIIDKLRESSLVKSIASEEQSELIEIENASGTFGVVLDPLDGSSLIGVNLSVGTIVGIFDEGDVMEPGSRMDAALYLMYGPLTVLVYSAGKGVHEFVLSQDGVFRLLHENLRIPPGEKGKLYAPGGKRREYLPYHEKYISLLESDGYKLRYSGAFVADFHQILHKGGVFCYPATKSAPNGKLRLIFEANPMTFLVKQAGGKGSDGTRDIHSIVPRDLSQRTPLYIGSSDAVDLIEKVRSELNE